MNGVPANWIRDSLEERGLDLATLPSTRTPMPEGVRPWRDLFSAGQSVGLIDRVEPVHELVARLADEFALVAPNARWRERLAAIESAFS
jgi:nitronate monooxygenase